MERLDGTKLYTLEGLATRPTLDRVKESIFNIIQNDIVGANVLDLFSGSGAMALEAISRGAKHAVLCDKSKDAINIINKNVEKTHSKDKVSVYNSDFEECLNKIQGQKFDLIFLDPPYKTNLVKESIQKIINLNLIGENSKIIIETDSKEIVDSIQNLDIKIIDTRKYGRAYIVFVKA